MRRQSRGHDRAQGRIKAALEAGRGIRHGLAERLRRPCTPRPGHAQARRRRKTHLGPAQRPLLATYLPLFKGKKVGIVVRAATPAASWNSCRRTSSTVRTWSSSAWAATEPSTSTACCQDRRRDGSRIRDRPGATLKVRADGRTTSSPCRTQDKCRACTVAPNAVIHDHFAGSPTNIPDGAQPAMPAIMTFLDGLSLEDRMGFWRGHIDRYIRCYACRNRLPHVRVPRQLRGGQPRTALAHAGRQPTQKMFFQLIHAMHLAGRCTGCGECNRACPMGIPVGARPDGPRREEVVRIRPAWTLTPCRRCRLPAGRKEHSRTSHRGA